MGSPGSIGRGRRILPLIPPLLAFVLPPAPAAEDPTPAELLAQVGIPPQGDLRGQMDTVGFATEAAQMDRVLARCRVLAAAREKELAAAEERGPVAGSSGAGAAEGPLAAAVCPHDDYTYAGRLYTLLLSRVRAPRVVLFGVFHKARVYGCRDRLVFDTWRAWRGPYGPVRVSPLREEILSRLPEGDVLVSGEMHQVEHSLEALVPFLQAFNREVEIVPILVPAMDWPVIERLAGELSRVLEGLCREKGWRLGRDLALVCSADAVHYGDEGWGGQNFAPFGADAAGYLKAVEQDRALAAETLCGAVEPGRLRDFFYRCVDPADVTRYRLTWCGRFSIPCGLLTAASLAEALEGRKLEGTLLDYGTSVSEASLDGEEFGGLGATAPNNFHHFVGYAAIGYR